MDKWNVCELQNVCSRLSSGKGIRTKDISAEGLYPVYGGNGLRGYTNTYNFDGECAIIGRQGANCGNVRFFQGKAYMTEHAVVVCANENNDTRFLSYMLGTMQLGRLSGQSAQPGLSVKTLGIQPLNIPRLSEQKRISSLLGTFDDKIVYGALINKNLEEQAQAIYCEMFSNGVDGEWQVGMLSEIADITMGQSPKGDTYNEIGDGTVFYQGRAEFGFRFPTQRLYTTEPKRMAQENDVLMSVRAPVGDINVARESCCIGRGLAAIHSKFGCQSFILYTMLNMREKIDIFNGEGTVFGSINRDALNSLPIDIPPAELIDKFENIVSPLDSSIRTYHEEICRLEILRDTLLPRLMSGEIDVSNIDI